MCFIQVGSLDKQKANIDEISFDEIKNIKFYNGSINIVKTEIIEKYAMPYNEKIKQQNMQ